MNDINRIMLLGRLGQDPILRETKTGIKVASFSLATEVYLRTKQESETTWHKIVTWGKAAESVNRELKKGMPVFLEGKIKQRKYEAADKTTRTVYEVHVDMVRYLHRRLNLKTSPLEMESKLLTEEQVPEILSIA